MDVGALDLHSFKKHAIIKIIIIIIIISVSELQCYALLRPSL